MQKVFLNPPSNLWKAFKAGKEIEAMKRLMLHHIASSLHRFITSSFHHFSFENKSSSFAFLLSRCNCFSMSIAHTVHHKENGLIESRRFQEGETPWFQGEPPQRSMVTLHSFMVSLYSFRVSLNGSRVSLRGSRAKAKWLQSESPWLQGKP
jgi:hypothetical protein